MATLVSQEAVIYMQKYKASQQLPGHPSGRHWTRRAVSIGVYVFLIAGSPLSKAQVQAAPKRLSDWLLEQPYKHDAYYLGLSWRVTDEVPTQYALRQELLQTLTSTSRDITASTKAVNRLRAWIASLPVTGRVPIANADVRWLQANPVRDPILLAGHSVVLPRRPTTVTVITGNGTRCAANHAAGYEVRAYLNACGVTNADWAWIAQPDGRIQRFGVATWNRELQNDLAPGAWIWAPSRGSGYPDLFSQQLITFLATQEPAPDPNNVPQQAASPAVKPKIKHTGPGAGGASRGYSTTSGHGISDDTSQRLAAADLEMIKPTALPPLGSQRRSRSLEISANDWGNVGLLQTPTARMFDAGHFSFTYSRTQPYTRGNFFLQPFDWFEVGFRYIDISNRLYDPIGVFNTTQSNKDKSIDIKARLWPESAYV